MEHKICLQLVVFYAVCPEMTQNFNTSDNASIRSIHLFHHVNPGGKMERGGGWVM